MSNVTPLHPQLPEHEPVQILVDANVQAVKLFRAIADAGLVFTFDRGSAVLRISERHSN